MSEEEPDTERDDDEPPEQLEELDEEQLPGLDPWLPPPSEE